MDDLATVHTSDEGRNARAGGRDWLAALLLRQHERFAPRLAAAVARWRATPRGIRRRLNRRVALTAAGTALALSMVAGPMVPRAQAATIAVDGVTCNLVDAIIAANTDTATGGCAAGSGLYDVLDLTADVTLTSAYGYYYNSDTGLPLVASEIVLEGNGHTIARDGAAPPFRLMAVAASGELTLVDVTLTGGYADNAIVDAAGGAIYSTGVIEAYSANFIENRADGYGGAIASLATTFMAYSDVTGNFASGGGGGVASDGVLYVVGGTITGNYSAKLGGGVATDGIAVLFGSTISGNAAPFGGGALNYGGFMGLYEASVLGNLAIYGGGMGNTLGGQANLYQSAVAGNVAYVIGGGVHSGLGAHTDIANSTVSGNYGGYAGGGVLNDEATAHIYHATISRNAAFLGGGVAGTYLYVLGGEGGASAVVEGARPDRAMSAEQREQLRATLPAGMAPDAADLERLQGMAASGTRPSLALRAGAFADAFRNADATRVEGFSEDVFTLEGSRLSGDTRAKVQAAREARDQSHIRMAHAGHAAAAGHPGPDAYAYYAVIAHSIISGGYAANGTELFGLDPDAIVSYEYNVLAHDGVTTAQALYGVSPSGTDFNAASDAGDVPLEDILSQTLAYNGGFTLNHALVSGSPAIDMIDHGADYDQRDYLRPVNGYHDAGAYEFTPLQNVYVSSDKSGVTDDAVAFGPHDVLGWDDGDWSTWFDGDGAQLMPNGRKKHNINAIWLPDPDSTPYALFSFSQNSRFVPGITGKVDGMDIVFWDGTNFNLAFDGQDVGLTNKSQEKIDALHVLSGYAAPEELQVAAGGCGDYFLISTQGPGAVPGLNGTIRFSGEDVLGFCMTDSGATTQGKWIKVLDGSDEGMPRNSLANLAASENGKTLYLMTRGAFNVDDATGGHSMIYRYDFGSGQFSGPLWSAPAEGMPAYLDALHIGQ